MEFDAIALESDLDDAGHNPLFAAFIASVAMFALAAIALLASAAMDASADTTALVSDRTLAINVQSLSSSLEYGSGIATATFGALALGILGVLVVRGMNGQD